MNNSLSVDRLPLAAFAAGCIVLLTIVLVSGPETAGRIALEDGPAEYLQALFYVGGLVASVWAFMRGYNRLLAGLWAVLCLLFFGEETSWMQRIFDYSVPSVEATSSQGEFNLHNQFIFGSGRLLAEGGGLNFSLSALLNSQNIFRLGFFIYFLALPVMMFWQPIARLLGKVGFVCPPRQVLAVIWPFVAVTFVFTSMHVEPMKFYLAEVRETVYAATIFIYCLALYVAGKYGGIPAGRIKLAKNQC